MTSGRFPLYLVALIAAAAALTQARATPLDGETCAKLESEHSQLENGGIEKEMAKGPAWAKANLAADKLQQVRRFIEIEAQLLFRCGKRALVNLPPDPDASAPGNQADEPDKDAGAPKSKAAPKAGEPPSAPATKAKGTAPKQSEPAQKQPAAKPAAQPKKADSGAAKPAPPAAEPGVTTIQKRPPKPKADDAFKAPPPDPAVNPFAGQLKGPAKE